MRSFRAIRITSSTSPFLKPRLPLRHQLRSQHQHQTSSDGEKWYFQGPDFVPPPPRPGVHSTPAAPGPSRTARMLRSTLYASLFCIAGFAAANGFTTWTWLATAFTPGEEGDTMYLELINERLDSEPLTQLLTADPEWSQMTGLSPDGLDNCLRGSRGVQVRHWFNPAKASLIVMIHFGEGVEGWPQTVHGGVLSSFVHNAMELMAPSCFRPPKPHAEYDQASWAELVDGGYFRADRFEMAFERPVASGDVYCIWICPAFVLGEELLVRTEKSRLPKIEREDLQRSLIGSVLQIDFFPYEAGHGQRFIRYANAVGTFGQVNVVEPKKPVQLTMDGKII